MKKLHNPSSKVLLVWWFLNQYRSLPSPYGGALLYYTFAYCAQMLPRMDASEAAVPRHTAPCGWHPQRRRHVLKTCLPNMRLE
ncbi:hypothetical protein IE81DRAFT_219352 [Ceraceosorus guamensis]|uniref:Uncharacterized protein n=1 Tax=Ceraceosorus guamensis TaxID=1522189 RepID=A0A316VYF7_9BASI|nr:hypothetical protein IE81DRAFT_219352 [Ceraceosorus guamensis]PWN40505.1 hypothetical protein IE81DRAFT_219352 [Ceraceosorus guamensis]